MLKKTPVAAALTLAFSTYLSASYAQTLPGTPAPSTRNANGAGTPGASAATPGAASSPAAAAPVKPTPAPAAPATAASAAASTLNTESLPTVAVSGSADRNDFQPIMSSVGGKTPTALHDIAQSVTVVNQAVMKSQGVSSFQDALRNVPGVTIGGAEGGQIGNNINLRGFTARTDIYLDGFRDPGQYYRDTFDLESIDVLYGPSSMLFGRGSTGGVINQVSKQANLKQSAEVSGTIGTDDKYRSTFDINQPLSSTSAFRLDGFGQDMHSSRDVEVNRDYGFAPNLRFGIGTPTEVTLSALIEHNNDMPDYGVQALNGHPFSPSRSTFYGLTDDRTIQDTQIFNATVKHKVNDQLTLQNKTQYAHYLTDARETAAAKILTGPLATSTALAAGNFTTLNPSQLYVQLASHDRVINQHTLYNDSDVLYKFTTGPFKHDLDVGIEVGRETYNNQATTRNNLPIVSLLNPVYEATPGNVTTTVGNLADASANTFATYFNDTISIGDHWKFVGGLRWDRFKAEIANSVSLPAYASQTNNFTSVRTGLIYQPQDWSTYYISYGTSFDPSLESLTVTNFTQALPPETNKSYEIGGKWDGMQGRLSLTAALFQVEKANARTQVSATEYELDGDIRVRGTQLGLTGHLSDKWQVFGGYTFMNALVVKAADGTAGNTPANTPRNTLTLWNTYNVTPQWEVGGGATYMSSRFAANTDLVKAGGYTRYDAEVAYHQPRYDVRLNVLNLTNKNYYDALIASDGGRSVPAVGRTVLATATYRFF